MVSSKERAFAQGIFNSGAAIGGIISIPLIAFLSVYFGWKAIFILIGLVGLVWLIPWLYIVKAPPEGHPWITNEERDYITKNRSGDNESAVVESEYDPSTMQLLGHKQSWGVIIASAAIEEPVMPLCAIKALVLRTAPCAHPGTLPPSNC